MKARAILVSVLVALAACAVLPQALAAPSLEGYTGLLLIPTADALNQGEYNVAFFALSLEEGADSNVFAANLGLAGAAEVGIARLRPEGGPSETLLNGKYNFRAEEGGKPALAVGVIDATDEIETTAYVVASQTLSRNVLRTGKEIASPRVHVGIGGGRLNGLFFGASAVLGDTLTLIAEYDSEDVNLGARLALGQGLRAHAGWINGLNDVALGVSFNKQY